MTNQRAINRIVNRPARARRNHALRKPTCRQRVNATDALSRFILLAFVSGPGFLESRVMNNEHRSCFVDCEQQYSFREYNRNARLRWFCDERLITRRNTRWANDRVACCAFVSSSMQRMRRIPSRSRANYASASRADLPGEMRERWRAR